MKNLAKTFALILSFLFLVSCETDNMFIDSMLPDDLNDENSNSSALKNAVGRACGKAAGSIEFEFKESKSEMGNQPEDRRGFFSFTAYEENVEGVLTRGEIIFRVTKSDYTLHREIKAVVKDVFVDREQNKAWIIGEVISDSKGCGGQPGGHEPGCSDEHDDEGCADSGHDSGCSHDDAGETDSGTGCSHETGETDDGHDCNESENPNSGETGNHLSGKNCRIGQLIALKVHDGDTRLTKGDGITWKWFDPDASFVPAINNISGWPHLCKKTIVSGNIYVY